MTPVFITSFNVLSTLRQMLGDVQRCAELYIPIIVDNASTYPPLVEWLNTNPCKVVRYSENLGSKAAWADHRCTDIIRKGRFIVTDCDLDLSGCDLRGFHNTAHMILDTDPSIIKVGLSLRIDDLPDTELSKAVLDRESVNWRDRYPPCAAFLGETDTTWAMYRAGSGWLGYSPSVRIGPPARHVPWYLDHENLPEDYAYAIARVLPGFTIWSGLIKARTELPA